MHIWKRSRKTCRIFVEHVQWRIFFRDLVYSIHASVHICVCFPQKTREQDNLHIGAASRHSLDRLNASNGLPKKPVAVNFAIVKAILHEPKKSLRKRFNITARK